MPSPSIDFLKDQVQRLNSVLAQYQARYPLDASLNTDQVPSSSGSSPWLTDQSVLSPLLAEYDKIVNSQQQVINVYKNEQADMRNDINNLIAENERLYQEIRNSLPSGLPAADDAGMQTLTSDEQMVENFQQQLQLALQEKDIIEEKWRIASQEIDRLELELSAEKESHQWRVVEQQAQQVKDQYMQTVTDLNKEIESLQAQLKQTRAELNTSNTQLSELRRAESELKQQLLWKEQEQADIMFKDGISDCQVRELKRVSDDLRQKVSSLMKEVDCLRMEKESLEAIAAELRNKIVDLEDKESEYIRQVRDAVAMVETAMLEKEQAEMACCQKAKECEQLQEVINKLVNETGVHARQEVDKVKRQYNERISKLTEEVHNTEMMNTELQAQLERLLRDKRSAESELEKMYKDGTHDGSKYKDAFDDVNRRAIDAERARCEAEHKIEVLENMMKRLEMDKEQLCHQLHSQLEQTKDRMKSMEREFEDLNEERLRFLDEIDRLKSRLQEANKEKEAAFRKCLKENATKEQDILSKVREYQVKLEATEDTNRQAMSSLRKLLSAQQRMSARWKEECHSITLKFETKVNDLRTEIFELKKRNAELCSLLKESQEKSADAERKMSEYACNVRRMASQVMESHQSAHDCKRKLAHQLERQRFSTREKESMLREMSMSQRERRNLLGHQSSLDRSNESQPMTEMSVEHRVMDVEDLLSER